MPLRQRKKAKRCCQAKTATSWGTRIMVVLVVAILTGAIFIGLGSVGDEPAPGAGKVWSPEHGHYH